MDTRPLWFEADIPPFAALDNDLVVDTLVIGAGITGVTTAHLLAAAGVKVALVDREAIAVRDTVHTTAHLTYMTDTRLSHLAATHSPATARIAWQAGAAAMGFIHGTVESLGIDCEFGIVPGYLAADRSNLLDHESSILEQEAQLARKLGFDVTYLNQDPVTGLPCLYFPGQMKFHPRRYLAALVSEAVRAGAIIHEHTDVTAFQDGHVIANGHRITYHHVIIATHVPLQGESGTLGAALFQAKLSLYSSYAVAAKLPPGQRDEMIWSDTADPFNYLRIDRHDDGDFAIFGGEDHKTGQSDTTKGCFDTLEERLAELLPGAVVTHRWSGQVVESIDGLPFIGLTREGQFIATGFSGNGMTFGTLAAMMARDAVLGIDNPWSKTFSPSRKVFASLRDFLSENSDYPVHMVTDRFRVSHDSPASIIACRGKIIEHDSGPVAAFRDEEGQIHLHSAVCPHLGCIVAWTHVEKTWDCPCHGSRFRATGELIAGPAESNLKPVPQESN